MYLLLFVSCFLLLIVPSVSAITYRLVQDTAEENLSKNIEIKGDIRTGKHSFSLFINFIRSLVGIYVKGFILTFVFSLFITIPIAIWITYSGSIFEVLTTAFMLSFITAFKWPVLLIDVIIRLFPGDTTNTSLKNIVWHDFFGEILYAYLADFLDCEVVPYSKVLNK
jgi:hypothetical protein